MCIQEIVKLIDSNETVCVCYGNDYEYHFTVTCAMLRMFLNTCIRISVMPLGINKGKLCLHTDLNTYEQMRKYFGF